MYYAVLPVNESLHTQQNLLSAYTFFVIGYLLLWREMRNKKVWAYSLCFFFLLSSICHGFFSLLLFIRCLILILVNLHTVFGSLPEEEKRCPIQSNMYTKRTAKWRHMRKEREKKQHSICSRGRQHIVSCKSKEKEKNQKLRSQYNVYFIGRGYEHKNLAKRSFFGFNLFWLCFRVFSIVLLLSSLLSSFLFLSRMAIAQKISHALLKTT